MARIHLVVFVSVTLIGSTTDGKAIIENDNTDENVNLLLAVKTCRVR